MRPFPELMATRIGAVDARNVRYEQRSPWEDMFSTTAPSPRGRPTSSRVQRRRRESSTCRIKRLDGCVGACVAPPSARDDSGVQAGEGSTPALRAARSASRHQYALSLKAAGSACACAPRSDQRPSARSVPGSATTRARRGSIAGARLHEVEIQERLTKSTVVQLSQPCLTGLHFNFACGCHSDSQRECCSRVYYCPDSTTTTTAAPRLVSLRC